MNQKKCLTLLTKLDIKYELVEHKAVYTIEEAMAELPGRTEIKNLFLQDDKGKKRYLVIMPGLKKLDLKQLALDLNEKKIRFCSAEKVEEILGVKPGSVSIFCCLNNSSSEVKVIFDKALLNLDELGFHPIINTATVFIKPSSAIKLLNGLKQEHQIIKI